MLNSRNYVSDKEVLNAGETISPEVNLKDPNTKVYYHQVPGALTHMPDGAQIQFLGGQFATANTEIKAYLDKIADKKGSMVFTRKTVGVTLDHAIAATDAAKPSGDAGEVLQGKNLTASPEMIAKVESKPETPDILPGQTKPAATK
jgi:hypothetical protein